MWAQAPGIQCSQLADVAPLGAGLEKLQALTSLKLNFERCSQLLLAEVGSHPLHVVASGLIVGWWT